MSKRARVLEWVQHCGSNDVFVYHRTGGKLERDPNLFAYMRKLSDGGLVFLFQRRTDQGEWEYCARRCRPKDHAVLDKVSADVQGPAIQATED